MSSFIFITLFRYTFKKFDAVLLGLNGYTDFLLFVKVVEPNFVILNSDLDLGFSATVFILLPSMSGTQ